MTWPVDFVSDRAWLVVQDRPLIGLRRGLVDVLAVGGLPGRQRATGPVLALAGRVLRAVHPEQGDDDARGVYSELLLDMRFAIAMLAVVLVTEN
jgi:hypothetical protein